MLLITNMPLMHVEGDESVVIPSKEKFHVFLLAGQSNMAGRGEVTSEDKTTHPRVLSLSREGKWVPAVDPLHWDKEFAGVGPGKSFALELVKKDQDITIGLVPAACGGSPISRWEPGEYHDQTKSYPWDDAITRTRLALEDGTLKGILWLQGESDGTSERAPLYKEKLRSLIQRFRIELNAEEIPFIIGQLGQFPDKPWSEARKLVNDSHIEIANSSDKVSLVFSEGLTCKNDNTHFNAESMKEYGKRYAEAYMKMLDSNSSLFAH